jgi:aconitate hydratase
MAAESRETLGLDGTESYTIMGISDGLSPRQVLKVEAKRGGGEVTRFDALLRIDNAIEVEYVRHGGILPMVLRNLIAASEPVPA